MSTTVPADTAPEAEQLTSLERRVADLESRIVSPKGWRDWIRSLLRWLAMTPPLLLLLLIGLDHVSSRMSLSVGVLGFILWASATVLWAVVELFSGGNLTFRVTRLILIVAFFAVILGYWNVTVRQPYVAEQRCLASLKGLDPDIRRKTIGPGWLIGLVGEDYFRRVDVIEIGGLEADVRQIRLLHALPHLSSLWLRGTRIDDAVIDDVTALTMLRHVRFLDTRVTKSGVDRVRRARPGLDVSGNVPAQ